MVENSSRSSRFELVSTRIPDSSTFCCTRKFSPVYLIDELMSNFSGLLAAGTVHITDLQGGQAQKTFNQGR